MGKIVGIRTKPHGKICDYSTGHFVLSAGYHVIVPSDEGLVFGTVARPPRPVRKEASNALRKVYRLANDGDIVQHSKNLDLEKSARTYCLECVVKLRLEMNLASVACLFDKSKLIFYYTADGRVDFRELVKMLIKEYKVRIEMRQIGVRNRAKMCGGYGRCGQSLCCCTFVNDFEPISVRMAKEQGLMLNPSKISGLCGRLMCCLAFEHETYCDLKRRLPECGETVQTRSGQGKVVRQNILKESVTVQFDEASAVDVGFDEIRGAKEMCP